MGRGEILPEAISKCWLDLPLGCPALTRLRAGGLLRAESLMGPTDIILLVVAVLAVGAVIWLVARPSKELPAAPTQPKLERPKPEEIPTVDETAKLPPAEEVVEPAPSEPAGVAEPEPAEIPPAEIPPAELPTAKIPTAEILPTQPEPTEVPPPEPTPEPTLELPKVEPPKPAAKPLFAPPPTFAPPKPKLAPAEPTPKPRPVEPTPKPKPVELPKPKPAPIEPPEPEREHVVVPLPIDKPKLPSREDREQAELAARKSERDRYRKGLKKTKRGFIAKLARLFKGKPKVSDDLKDEIEEVLFTADIGAKAAAKLLASVTDELDKKEVADPDAVWSVIRTKALEILDIETPPPNYTPEVGPYTLLMIGVNGVGKTTTIGKLAARHVDAGRKTLMVAGDTFRAAAGEQLEVWARRVGCDIHLGKDGADPSSVLFDGITRGREQGYDVILCDTAGRLHTRKELMDELGKMGRAAAKALSKGRGEMEPHDTFLVLDATIGQNALAQAQMFKETMNFTGLVLTKLDGTAKGGVVLGVVDELGVPIRYIGIGESVDDLRQFDPEAFCEVLFKPDEDANGDGDDD
jgi:fused signal recognition particle receptor